jgi:RimJ/RimL family protein N-acetyltransferase
VRVRRATVEDAESFAAVVARVAPEGLIAAEPPVDVEERAAKARELVQGEGPDALWVLEEDGAVVGATGVHTTRARGVLTLGMAILPEFRGRGAGRQLLEAAIEHARGTGAHKLELEVWPDNGRAIALYVAAGFAVEGVRRSHYRRADGSLRSSIVMGLLLEGGADP